MDFRDFFLFFFGKPKHDVSEGFPSDVQEMLVFTMFFHRPWPLSANGRPSAASGNRPKSCRPAKFFRSGRRVTLNHKNLKPKMLKFWRLMNVILASIFWLQYLIVWQGRHLFNASDCSTGDLTAPHGRSVGTTRRMSWCSSAGAVLGSSGTLAAGRLMNIILASIFLGFNIFWASIFLGFNISWLQYFLASIFHASIFSFFNFFWLQNFMV